MKGLSLKQIKQFFESRTPDFQLRNFCCRFSYKGFARDLLLSNLSIFPCISLSVIPIEICKISPKFSHQKLQIVSKEDFKSNLNSNSNSSSSRLFTFGKKVRWNEKYELLYNFSHFLIYSS